MIGLTDDQIAELRLKAETDKYYPSGGSEYLKDDLTRRTGEAPRDNMQRVLFKTVEEARAAIHRDLGKQNIKVDEGVLRDTLDKLRGAVMIVYPMGLPPYDDVQIILDDAEDLSGTQASKEVSLPVCLSKVLVSCLCR